eukprot:scaffold74299_cov69-Phaeocystis_antarctica.AAC.1
MRLLRRGSRPDATAWRDGGSGGLGPRSAGPRPRLRSTQCSIWPTLRGKGMTSRMLPMAVA